MNFAGLKDREPSLSRVLCFLYRFHGSLVLEIATKSILSMKNISISSKKKVFSQKAYRARNSSETIWFNHFYRVKASLLYQVERQLLCWHWSSSIAPLSLIHRHAVSLSLLMPCLADSCRYVCFEWIDMLGSKT